jgi:alkylation response protein AidB-like acyl-CoA dehydrogenase
MDQLAVSATTPSGGEQQLLDGGQQRLDSERHLVDGETMAGPPPGALSPARVPQVDLAALRRSDEQRDLATTVRRFFAEMAPLATTVRWLDHPRGHDVQLWRRMAGELGVQGLAVPERFGGSGFSFADLAVVLEESGRALLAVPLLSSTVLASQALLAADDEAVAARFLPDLCSGTTTATLVGTGDAAGLGLAGTPPTLTARSHAGGYLLDGTVDFVLDGAAADLVLVLAEAPAGPSLFAVERGAGVNAQAYAVLDPTRPQARLTFTAAPGVLVGAEGDGSRIVSRALQCGVAGLAAQQVGGSRHALERTVEYVRERRQFGRAIGSFQAIKHRLADLLVAVEAARTAAAYAVASVSGESGDGTSARGGARAERFTELAVAAPIAKSVCSQAFHLATAELVQLHGGIGFTWEHEAHRYLRRARADEVLLGTPAQHRALLAARLGLGVT